MTRRSDSSIRNYAAVSLTRLQLYPPLSDKVALRLQSWLIPSIATHTIRFSTQSDRSFYSIYTVDKPLSRLPDPWQHEMSLLIVPFITEFLRIIYHPNSASKLIDGCSDRTSALKRFLTTVSDDVLPADL